MRIGLTLLTNSRWWRSHNSAASRSASSKFPASGTTCAPWATAWLSLPSATLPPGTTTTEGRRARAAYAAADADVLPVDAHTTALAPSSTALEIATVMPRSLKDPVGFAPSNFRNTLAPTRSLNFGAGSTGVLPSNNVTTGVATLTGRDWRYASMSP